MSSKSSKNSRTASKKSATATPKVGFPKRIDLKADHLKLLREINGKEKQALDMVAQAYLRIRQLNQQIEKLERDIISPQEQEVYRKRNRLIEIGQSFMDFYELPQKDGFTWQLTIDEGAWILVPLDQNQ